MSVDIIKELGDSRLYTLHSHTEFCDGRAQMEAFAREAVARQFTHYGFTPHSPIPFASPCNMTRDHVADYDSEFYRINATYGDRVKFYRSMEIDYLGESWGPSSPWFDDLGLDYRLGSVHFIPDQQGRFVDIDGHFDSFQRKMKQYFRDDIRYVVETFYASSCAMVEAGGLDIIGHLDKVGHNAAHFSPGIEDEPWYRALVDNLIDLVIDRGIIVEINTKALAGHNRFFPSVAHWERLLSAGVPLIVNSDAHVPALIDAGRPEAYAILDKIEQSLNLNANAR